MNRIDALTDYVLTVLARAAFSDLAQAQIDNAATIDRSAAESTSQKIVDAIKGKQ